MTLQVNTAQGVATVAGRDDGQGHLQGVLAVQGGWAPLYATWYAISSAVQLVASGVPSANLLLVTLDPGAGVRWLTAGTPNASLGHPLMAQGSYPEAIQFVGSAMLSSLRFVLLGGETTPAKANFEFYKQVL